MPVAPSTTIVFIAGILAVEPEMGRCEEAVVTLRRAFYIARDRRLRLLPEQSLDFKAALWQALICRLCNGTCASSEEDDVADQAGRTEESEARRVRYIISGAGLIEVLVARIVGALGQASHGRDNTHRHHDETRSSDITRGPTLKDRRSTAASKEDTAKKIRAPTTDRCR